MRVRGVAGSSLVGALGVLVVAGCAAPPTALEADQGQAVVTTPTTPTGTSVAVVPAADRSSAPVTTTTSARPTTTRASPTPTTTTTAPTTRVVPIAAAPSATTADAPATSTPPSSTADPATTTAAPTTTPPAPATRAGTVNGCNTYGQYCDGNPLYATVPAAGYDYRVQPKNGTVDNGVQLTASCWATGGTTTNFASYDPGPDPYGSDVYYLAATADGVVGYIPDTYFVRDASGMGLPACS